MDADPVFEQTDRLYGTTSRRFLVVRCQGCGLLRLQPAPAARELAAFYPDDYWFQPDSSQPSRWAERYRRFVLGDHIRFVERAWRHAGADGPLLDIGCGGGLLPGLLRRRGIPAFGFDSSVTACRIAWSRHSVPACPGTLIEAPFRPRTFAVLTLFHVLEHLPDPFPYLAAAGDLLMDGGRLVVQVPNAASWQAKIFGKRWNGFDVPRHLNNFRVVDLERALRRAGFEVTRRKHFSLRDNPAGLATSIAPALDPVARRVRRRPSNAFHFAAYFALVLVALPFVCIEAAFGRGASIMLEARKA